MRLTLRNTAEDAYWVQVTLSFPQGLSFRKVEILKVSERAGPAHRPGARLVMQHLLPPGAPGSQDSLKMWVEVFRPRLGSQPDGHK